MVSEVTGMVAVAKDVRTVGIVLSTVETYVDSTADITVETVSEVMTWSRSTSLAICPARVKFPSLKTCRRSDQDGNHRTNATVLQCILHSLGLPESSRHLLLRRILPPLLNGSWSGETACPRPAHCIAPPDLEVLGGKDQHRGFEKISSIGRPWPVLQKALGPRNPGSAAQRPLLRSQWWKRFAGVSYLPQDQNIVGLRRQDIGGEVCHSRVQ